ncbi:MAG TPA: oligosaccharide flippase family protein [Gemmataceae bacterium]|jgi:O-antigen/teichoic acid export membrane protein|nr:oligosaccharide flippase family protein [Gemmataceae bacterium]
MNAKLSPDRVVLQPGYDRNGCLPHPPERLALRVNFGWTLAGNVVYAACQWGMLVALAKLGSPEVVGQFALGLAVTAPVLMFTNLQMRSVQATDAKREYDFGDYLGLRTLTTAVGLLVIVGIVLVSGYSGATAAVIVIVGLAKGLESLSDVCHGRLQQVERMDRIAISMMSKGMLSLVILATLVLLTGSILWGTLGMAASWALVLVGYDLRSVLLATGQGPAGQGGANGRPAATWRRLRPRWAPGTLGRLVWLGLPLGVVMCLISLNTNIPRYFVEHDLGLRELGIFSAMGYVMVASAMVINALGQSATPRLAQYYAGGHLRAFRALLLKMVGLGAVIGAAVVGVAVVAGREVLALLYTPEYADHADAFVWLMVAAGIGCVASFLGYGMTAARYFRIQTPLFLVVTAATAAGCATLVPGHQLLGAAWAVAIAATVQVLGSAAVVAYALRHARPTPR